MDQLKEGHGYGGLCPVVVICILDAVMLPQNLPYHNEFRLRTTVGHELTNLYQINVLELPKFAPGRDNELIEDSLEQWMYIFRRAHGSTPRELLKRLTDPIFEEVLEILQMIHRNPDERVRYQSRLKAEHDRITEIQAAEERGVMLGTIRTLQSLLLFPQMTKDEYANLDQATIEDLIAQLQALLRSRS